jgi:hypothetical protein
LAENSDHNSYSIFSTFFSFFSPEYAFILENAEALENQFKRQPAHLERLYGQLVMEGVGTVSVLFLAIPPGYEDMHTGIYFHIMV